MLIAVAVVGGAMLVMLLWFIVSLVFRWRFQFSIRSLLVLTVAVVAIVQLDGGGNEESEGAAGDGGGD